MIGQIEYAMLTPDWTVSFSAKKTSYPNARAEVQITEAVISRREYFLDLYNSGMNICAIAKQEGLTRQRVHQILKNTEYKRRIKKRLTKSEKAKRRYDARVKKFWTLYEEDENGCWNWKGSLYPTGYGRFMFSAIRESYAHRASWIITNGPISNDLQVCHSCDNPSCINPDHLWLGTVADNMRDRDRKGRDKNGPNRPSLNQPEAQG